MDEANALVTVKLSKRLQQLDDILKRKGVDLSELEKSSVKSVGFYQMMHKDSDNEAVITDLARIEFAPSWDSGPEWPVIQPAPAVKPTKRAKSRARKGWHRAMIGPDMQIGYYRGPNGLVPIHDEKAIAIFVEACRRTQPDVIVLVGDNADFCELGTYMVTKAWHDTTQATICRCGQLAKDLREACPATRIIWIAGNHEERLPKYIVKNAAAAYGLRRAFEPEGWPVLTMPNLCHFDELDIEWLPGYPASDFWINDNLRVIHGNRARSGVTATSYLDDGRVSTISGHIHRHEHVERTRKGRAGPRTITAYSPGCLCRIDGVVPSTKSGHDEDGRPVGGAEDWQQGFGSVHYQPDDGLFAITHTQILDGWCMFEGQELVA